MHEADLATWKEQKARARDRAKVASAVAELAETAQGDLQQLSESELELLVENADALDEQQQGWCQELAKKRRSNDTNEFRQQREESLGEYLLESDDEAEDVPVDVSPYVNMMLARFLNMQTGRQALTPEQRVAREQRLREHRLMEWEDKKEFSGCMRNGRLPWHMCARNLQPEELVEPNWRLQYSPVFGEQWKHVGTHPTDRTKAESARLHETGDAAKKAHEKAEMEQHLRRCKEAAKAKEKEKPTPQPAPQEPKHCNDCGRPRRFEPRTPANRFFSRVACNCNIRMSKFNN